MTNLLEPNNNTPVPSLDDFQSFIRRWNYLYPIDRWWRSKYNIPFNSIQHQQADLVDMRLDYEEDYMFTKAAADAILNSAETKYKPGRGDWLNPQKNKGLSSEQTDELYEALDVDQIEVNENGQIVM